MTHKHILSPLPDFQIGTRPYTSKLVCQASVSTFSSSAPAFMEHYDWSEVWPNKVRRPDSKMTERMEASQKYTQSILKAEPDHPRKKALGTPQNRSLLQLGSRGSLRFGLPVNRSLRPPGICSRSILGQLILKLSLVALEEGPFCFGVIPIHRQQSTV